MWLNGLFACIMKQMCHEIEYGTQINHKIKFMFFTKTVEYRGYKVLKNTVD